MHILDARYPFSYERRLLKRFQLGCHRCEYSHVCSRYLTGTHNELLADKLGKRLLEIFIGIICACTPAAAKSLNYHIKTLDALKIFVVSQLSRIGVTTKQSQASLLSQTGDHHHQPGSYSELGVYQGPNYTSRIQGKGIQTFIHKGKQQDDVENDGIHLTYELENQYSLRNHPDYELTPRVNIGKDIV